MQLFNEKIRHDFRSQGIVAWFTCHLRWVLRSFYAGWVTGYTILNQLKVRREMTANDSSRGLTCNEWGRRQWFDEPSLISLQPSHAGLGECRLQTYLSLSGGVFMGTLLYTDRSKTAYKVCDFALQPTDPHNSSYQGYADLVSEHFTISRCTLLALFE